jgi:hypothetical protein
VRSSSLPMAGRVVASGPARRPAATGRGRNEPVRSSSPNLPGHAAAQRAAYLRLPSVER